MHRACVKIDFEMMIIHILCQAPYFFIFDKKSFEMNFGDIHEHNIKQTSLGHRDIVFLLSLYFFFFFFATTAFEMIFVKSGGLAREKRAERSTMDNKIWLSMHPRNFGSDKIVCTTYVPYVHTLHVHPINVDNRERARPRNKKNNETNFVGRKRWKFYSAVAKSEKYCSSHQGENERQWSKKVNRNTCNIYSLKRRRVTSCSYAKQRQKPKSTKTVCCTCKVVFC